MKPYFIFSILMTLLSVIGAAQELPKAKYGPRGAPRAITLAQSHRYLQSTRRAAPDYWALIGYYVPQFNNYSCSAAVVTTVINAARSPLPKTSDDTLITQQSLLSSVTAENWSERVSAEGFEGSHGTSLDRFGRLVEATFHAYGFAAATVEAVHINDTSVATKNRLRRVLTENEQTANDFIMVNFNQQAFTDDADVGHIAAVAAYDAAHEKVLILDPDREWYEPYWVSLDTFMMGMATRDEGAGANRGYVRVQLNR